MEDSKPGEDLDGDGNADDGLPDGIYGYPFDEIWNFDLKTVSPGATGASTPTCYEFYDPNFSGASNGLANFPNREQVVVVMSDGKVIAFRALPRLATNGSLAPIGRDRLGNVNLNASLVEWVVDTNAVTGLTLYPVPATNTELVPGATWSEGVVFVAINVNNGGTTTGRVVAIDPRGTGGGRALSAFNPTGPTGLNGIDSQVPLLPGTPAFVGTPTVGYVRDYASGALDKMIYVYTDRPTTGNGSQSLRAIPFGAKGELLVRQAADTFLSRSCGMPSVPWFVVDPANPGVKSLSLGQRVYATYTADNGDYFSKELTYTTSVTPANDEYNVPQPTGPGVQQSVKVGATINFPNNGPIASPGAVAVGDGHVRIYGDYVLDWTLDPVNQPTLAKVGVRSSLNIPDTTQAGGTPNLLGGPPALSPDDLLYYTIDMSGTEAAGNAGTGTVLALNEQAAGRTQTRWTYAMFNQYTMTLLNGNTVTVPPRLRQLDLATQIVMDSGANTGNRPYITDVKFFGTPAVRKDVVYAVGTASIGGVQGSVLCAFKANPEFVLRLNSPIDKTQQVEVRQFNLANGSGQTGDAQWIRLTNQPSTAGNTRGTSAITVDYDSGLIHINSMSNPAGAGGSPDSGRIFATASAPWVVRVGQTEQVLAGKQLDIVGGQQEGRMIGATGVDNLLWFAVIPANGPANSNFAGIGLVSSSPSVQGDTIFLGTTNGYLLSLDADPGSTDPSAQTAGAQVQLLTYDPVKTTFTLNHLRWVRRVVGPSSLAAVRSAPVATENVLVANSADGAIAFEDAFTIIADSNRLIEVNSAGEAVWTCEGTRTYGEAGGDIPQFDPAGNVTNAPATGVPVVQKIPFARPSVARRINTNDFLVVDTGNNRVVEIDRGGNVVWEVHRMFDDYKALLRPGDPLALNEPTDCSYWTEYTQNLNAWFANEGTPYTYNNLPGFIIHYLITDTGNFRVIEMVDVYNSGGQPVRPFVGGNQVGFTLLRQLNFASNTFGTQGKKYRYRGVQRTLQVNGSLKGTTFYDPGRPDNAIRRFTLAAVTNYRLGSGSATPSGTNDETQGGGGSILVLDEKGAPVSVVTNLAAPIGAGTYQLQPIDNPTSFSKYDEYDVTKKTMVFHYLLSDANGCYQLVSDVDSTGKPVLRVEWMLTNDDYFHMTGKRLNAMSLRRLNTAVVDNTLPGFGLHRFLIANRFSGSDLIPSIFGVTSNVPRNGEFDGEVFELDPAQYDPTKPYHGYAPNFGDYIVNGGFLVQNPNAAIVWRSPTESVPVLANANGRVTRSIGFTNRATSTGNLSKPSYADRPF